MPDRSYITRTALIVALGGFLMGFDASVISGVVGFIETQFTLTKLELGWAVSSLTLTATLAMMVAGPLSDALGRRRVLFFAAVLYAVSAVASALAPSFWFLVAARMIGEDRVCNDSQVHGPPRSHWGSRPGNVLSLAPARRQMQGMTQESPERAPG